MKKTLKLTAAAIMSAAAMNFMNITTHAQTAGEGISNWARRSQDEVNAHVSSVLADGTIRYEIQPGDTLSAIAEALEMSTELLAALNNIENPDLILAGTTLVFNEAEQTVVIENEGEEAVEITAEAAPAPVTEVAVVEEVAEWVTPEVEETVVATEEVAPVEETVVETPEVTPVAEEATVEVVEEVGEWVSFEETPEATEPVTEEVAYEETVVEEAPVVEETPVAEETPVVEEVIEETPVVEEEIVETPAVEEPVYEEPVVEEPVYEEPVYEEPVYEEPVYEEPVVEEPVYEEPVVEEPVYEEPVVDSSIPAHLQELASYPQNAGLSVSELEAKYEIRRRESTHNYDVYSVSGNHYGAYQMLDTYFSMYGDGTTSVSSQEAASNGYVAERYGSWSAALAAHNSQGWY